MCILSFHAGLAYILHYQKLLQELQGDSEDTAEFLLRRGQSQEAALTPISKSAHFLDR